MEGSRLSMGVLAVAGGVGVNPYPAVVDGRDVRLFSKVRFQDAGIQASETYAVPVVVSICLQEKIP